MTDVNTELEHKISIARNDSVTSDQEHTGFEKVGTVLICDQASTSPNGITSGINEKYFDGQLIRTPRNDDPTSLLAESFEDLSGVRGSVLYITNIRGRIVGNNPHRELITNWTRKNDKYSVLNNRSYIIDTDDLRDTVIDFEIVPITIGIQVGGPDPKIVDLEDGKGFIKFHKSGEPGEDDEIVLTVKSDTIEEKVKWYMPAKGPSNKNQVLGLDRVEGNEAYLKWVDQVIRPIDPDPTDNCIPNWIETEIQTNTCVTKTAYGVSDVTVERRKVKFLVCGEIGPAKCVTNPTSENCCTTEDPIYDCISFGSCSHKSYPNVLCATIETLAGAEQIQIEYDPIAIPGTSTVICDYRGTTSQGKTVYLAMGGQHIQDTSNTNPLSVLCYIDTEEYRLVNPSEDERVGCSPLFLTFSARNNSPISSVTINECQDILLDCPDLPPDDIDPPVTEICHGCTQLTEQYTYSMSGITGEFAEKGNGTFTLESTQPCLYLEEQTQYYFPNQISFVVVQNDYYSGYIPIGSYLVSLNIIAPSSYNEQMKYRSAEYIAHRNPNETCCKNYTLNFFRIVEFDYSDPGNPKLNSYFNRGTLPATVTIFAKPCGGGGNNGGCSNIECTNCPGKTPKRFVVTISGLTACSSLNGTYNYDQSTSNPCKFNRTGATVGSAYDEITLHGATATLSISNGVSNYAIFSGSYTSCTGLSLTFTGGGGSCTTDTAGTATATSDCNEGGGGGGGGSVSVPCCPSDNLPTDLVATFTGTYASFGTATLTWNGIRWEFNGTLSSGTCGTITQLILTCNNPGPPDWLLAITGTDIDTVTPISGALGSSTYNCAVPQIDFSAVSTSGACAGAFGVILSE